jgi:hypothetical protein
MGSAESCERQCAEQTNSLSLNCSKNGNTGQDFFTCCSSQSTSIETSQRILAQRALTPRGFGPPVVRVIRKPTSAQGLTDMSDSERDSKDSICRPWHKPSEIRGMAGIRISDSFDAAPRISTSSSSSKSRAQTDSTANGTGEQDEHPL